MLSCGRVCLWRLYFCCSVCGAQRRPRSRRPATAPCGCIQRHIRLSGRNTRSFAYCNTAVTLRNAARYLPLCRTSAWGLAVKSHRMLRRIFLQHLSKFRKLPIFSLTGRGVQCYNFVAAFVRLCLLQGFFFLRQIDTELLLCTIWQRMFL